MASRLWGRMGMPQSGQYWTPSLTYSRRRKWWISVRVATVLLRPPRLVRCSMATVGGMPKMASTSGPRRRLHELAGVGVEGLQVAPLALGEQDVEGQGALAAAGDAGDDGEAVPWESRRSRSLRLCSRALQDFDDLRSVLARPWLPRHAGPGRGRKRCIFHLASGRVVVSQRLARVTARMRGDVSPVSRCRPARRRRRPLRVPGRSPSRRRG